MSGKSPLGYSREPQAYEGINISVPTGGWFLIKARRIPTVNDKKYPIGSIWVDTVTQASFQLVDAPGVWVALGISSGPLNTLTGDAGGAIAPAAGNITLAGTADQITTTGAGSTITFSIPAAFIAPGSIASTTTVTATLGDITATNGNLVLGTAGNKLSIATGANASVGTSTLTNGTVTVATTAVTASSIILLTRQTVGTTGANDLGILSVGTIVAATSFVINAWTVTDATTLQADDQSVIGWMIIN